MKIFFAGVILLMLLLTIPLAHATGKNAYLFGFMWGRYDASISTKKKFIDIAVKVRPKLIS